MTVEVKLNDLPESVSDATISVWYKKPGDSVSRDEKLVDVETDKVMLEIPAPADGVLRAILQESGAVVQAGTVLAQIDEQAAPSQSVHVEDHGSTKTDTDTAQNIVMDDMQAVESEQIVTAPEPRFEHLSPAVRHLLAQHQLRAEQITPSGRDGRLLKQDVLAYLRQQQAQPELDYNSKKDPEPIEQKEEINTYASQDSVVEIARKVSGQRATRVEPMSRIRRMIAQRMQQAQQNAAILTTFNEVDMSQVIQLRAQYGEAFQQRHQVKLGFMSFFVKAVTHALQQFPIINAALDGDNIIYHEYYDIGIAVGSDRGLVVPVLRDTDHLDFAQIEQQIKHYATQAREGRIALEDISGGTFTITNGGVYGSLLSTPILNPPQSAILGLHKIMRRPVVVDDKIVIRPIMNLALSYDHRLIDGSDAVRFLVQVKNNIEDSARMLLGV